MDIANITSLGYVAFITFGLVWALTLICPTMDSKQKFLASVVIAIVVGFIPADLGNIILTKVKDGIGVATALAGFYQFTSKVATKIG